MVEIGLLLFLFFVILISFETVYGLKAGAPNVCRNENTNNLYCCFNYQIYNGHCIECKLGYTSRDGQPCRSCKDGYFGYKCLRRCKCSRNQLCDRTIGCVDKAVDKADSALSNYSTLEKEFLNVLTMKNYEQTTMEKHTEDQHVHNGQNNSTVIGSDKYPWTFKFLAGVFIVYIVLSCVVCFIMYMKGRNSNLPAQQENAYSEIEIIDHRDGIIPISQNTRDSRFEHSTELFSPSETFTHINTIADVDNTEHIISSEDSSSISTFDMQTRQIPDGAMENNNTNFYFSLLPRRQQDNPYTDCVIPVD